MDPLTSNPVNKQSNKKTDREIKVLRKKKTQDDLSHPSQEEEERKKNGPQNTFIDTKSCLRVAAAPPSHRMNLNEFRFGVYARIASQVGVTHWL